MCFWGNIRAEKTWHKVSTFKIHITQAWYIEGQLQLFSSRHQVLISCIRNETCVHKKKKVPVGNDEQDKRISQMTTIWKVLPVIQPHRSFTVLNIVAPFPRQPRFLTPTLPFDAPYPSYISPTVDHRPTDARRVPCGIESNDSISVCFSC